MMVMANLLKLLSLQVLLLFSTQQIQSAFGIDGIKLKRVHDLLQRLETEIEDIRQDVDSDSVATTRSNVGELDAEEEEMKSLIEAAESRRHQAAQHSSLSMEASPSTPNTNYDSKSATSSTIDAIQPAISSTTDALQPATTSTADTLKPAATSTTDALQPATTSTTYTPKSAASSTTDTIKPATTSTIVDNSNIVVENRHIIMNKKTDDDIIPKLTASSNVLNESASLDGRNGTEVSIKTENTQIQKNKNKLAGNANSSHQENIGNHFSDEEHKSSNIATVSSDDAFEEAEMLINEEENLEGQMKVVLDRLRAQLECGRLSDECNATKRCCKGLKCSPSNQGSCVADCVANGASCAHNWFCCDQRQCIKQPGVAGSKDTYLCH